jgi:hypothetical protein
MVVMLEKQKAVHGLDIASKSTARRINSVLKPDVLPERGQLRGREVGGVCQPNAGKCVSRVEALKWS